MRAIFLDRDGVINHNRSDHVKNWDEFVFLPGVHDALRQLHRAGYHTFVITNQAIINRGMVSADTVEQIHARMRIEIARRAGQIHDVAYCPHRQDEQCACRKPAPGLILQLATRWRIDLSRAYLVGDAWTDIAAGRAAGVRSVMVQTGRGTQQMAQDELRQHPPDHIAADLRAAVTWILGREGHGRSVRLPRLFAGWRPTTGSRPTEG